MEMKAIEPKESKETGESKETSEARKLDDATFEPQALVEQTGDFKQSEAIQANFTAVVEKAAALGEKAPSGTEAAVLGEKVPGGTEAARLGNKEAGGEKVAIDPIPMPNTGSTEAARLGTAPRVLESSGEAVGVKFAMGIKPANLGYKESAGSEAARLGEKAPGGGEAARLGEKQPGGGEGVPVNSSEVVAKFSTEQKAVYDQLSKQDQAALIRLIGETERINPGKTKGMGGGIIY